MSGTMRGEHKSVASQGRDRLFSELEKIEGRLQANLIDVNLRHQLQSIVSNLVRLQTGLLDEKSAQACLKELAVQLSLLKRVTEVEAVNPTPHSAADFIQFRILAEQMTGVLRACMKYTQLSKGRSDHLRLLFVLAGVKGQMKELWADESELLWEMHLKYLKLLRPCIQYLDDAARNIAPVCSRREEELAVLVAELEKLKSAPDTREAAIKQKLKEVWKKKNEAVLFDEFSMALQQLGKIVVDFDEAHPPKEFHELLAYTREINALLFRLMGQLEQYCNANLCDRRDPCPIWDLLKKWERRLKGPNAVLDQAFDALLQGPVGAYLAPLDPAQRLKKIEEGVAVSAIGKARLNYYLDFPLFAKFWADASLSNEAKARLIFHWNIVRRMVEQEAIYSPAGQRDLLAMLLTTSEFDKLCLAINPDDAKKMQKSAPKENEYARLRLACFADAQASAAKVGGEAKRSSASAPFFPPIPGRVEPATPEPAPGRSALASSIVLPKTRKSAG